MQRPSVVLLTVASLSCALCQADSVISQAHDNIGGTLYGGMTGLMIGGATGGPIGALAGAGIGALAGRHAQDAAGLSQRAYLVRTADGREVVVRSPHAEFANGQEVTQKSDRLQLAN